MIFFVIEAIEFFYCFIWVNPDKKILHSILMECYDFLRQLSNRIFLLLNLGLSFYYDKTRILFGNAEDSLQKLVTEVIIL